jgi:hypothetical protein
MKFSDVIYIGSCVCGSTTDNCVFICMRAKGVGPGNYIRFVQFDFFLRGGHTPTQFFI